jgi:hypothetical protein
MRGDKLADEKRADTKRIAADVQDHGERIRCLEKAAARSETSDQVTFKALNALLSHAITGNATGEMRKVQKELVDSIIEMK